MTLTVRNFTIEYRTPTDVDPAHSRDILDRTMTGLRRDLPRLLGQALASEDSNHGIIFIEQLKFDALISADWNEDAIANAIARQLLRSLWCKLSDSEALHFTDKTDLVAQFLLDLADGTAFTRDWHRIFDGLKPLPASAIVRTLTERDASTGLAALARLSPANVDRIISCLSAMDGQRVLSAWTDVAGPPCRDIRQIARALAATCRNPIRGRTANAEPEPVHGITFATSLFRQTAMGADAVTLRLADTLLAATQSGSTPADIDALVSSFKGDGDPEAASLRGVVSREDLQEALTILARAAVQHASEQYARHAGYWLLAPHVLEHTEAPSLIFAALALTAGPGAREVWRDAALRVALDLPSDDVEIIGALPVSKDEDFPLISSRPISVWRRDFKYLQTAAAALVLPKPLLRRPLRLAACALRKYANRLPGFSESSFPHLWANLLSTPGAIRAGDNGVFVALSPPPLDVLWRISGAGATDYRLPNGRHIIVEVRR